MSIYRHIDRAYLKDPAGILTLDRARTLISSDLGVSVLQVGCGALGNGTSLPDAERLAANLRASGHPSWLGEV